MVTHRTLHEQIAKIARPCARAVAARATSFAPEVIGSTGGRIAWGDPCGWVVATREQANGSVPPFENAPANAETGAQPRVMLN